MKMSIGILKSIEGTIGVSVIGLSALMIAVISGGLVSCAEDTVKINLSVAYDSEAQAVMNEALQAGDALSVRFLYTYPSRIIAGNQVVSVRPSTAIPVGGLENPAWETSQNAGYDINSANLTLQGVPLGNTSTEIYVEILRPGQLGQWYAIAFGCIRRFQGVELTKELLQTINGSTLAITKGRTCGGCNPWRTYTDYDDDRCSP